MKSMLVYDLVCADGHHFEGWFRNLADLEDQLAQGLLNCPICQNHNIARIPSVFGQVRPNKNDSEKNFNPHSSTFKSKSLEEKLKDFSSFIETSFENVGSRFTQEALKIHYGASPKRNIYGHSSTQEEQVLKSEGVNFVKFPFVGSKGDNPSKKN